jgi:hypothetical protein
MYVSHIESNSSKFLLYLAFQPSQEIAGTFLPLKVPTNSQLDSNQESKEANLLHQVHALVAIPELDAQYELEHCRA